MDKIAGRAAGVSPSLTLEITAKGNKLKAEGKDVVSFGAGEPDFNTPAYIIDKAKEALDKGLTKYTPASGTLELKKAIAAKLLKDNGLRYEPNQIVVSNGAKHSLYNVFSAIIDPGDEVIIPAPYWLTYPELVKLCGGVPVYVSARAEDGFKIKPEALEKAITKRTKALVFNNPSNPTGAVYSESEIRALAAVAQKADIYVVSDEIYEKLVYGAEFFSIASVNEKLYNNTVVVNGFSKTYSMTGWRVGYTASTKALASAMGGIQSHTTSNPNSIAQYAAAAAIAGAEGEAFLKEMLGTFGRRRRLMTDRLAAMKPLTFVEPRGAFYVMIGIENFVGKSFGGTVIKSAADFSNILIDGFGVVTVPCESFGADMFIRLSYAVSDADIIKGLDRIEKAVNILK
jgi:aspartate aminotransferase